MLEVLDDRGEHHDLRQREERVDRGPAGLRELDALAAVERLELVALEDAVAVVRATDLPVAIHLEDVASVPIDDQAADRERRIVDELADALRVAAVHDELVERAGDRERLEVRLVVQRQRVVHVEANELALVHPEVPVDVDAPPSGDVRARQRATQRFEENFGGFALICDGHGPCLEDSTL